MRITAAHSPAHHDQEWPLAAPTLHNPLPLVPTRDSTRAPPQFFSNLLPQPTHRVRSVPLSLPSAHPAGWSRGDGGGGGGGLHPFSTLYVDLLLARIHAPVLFRLPAAVAGLFV